MTKIGDDVGQRRQNKRPLSDARVRNGEFCVGQNQLVVEEDIDVDKPRPPLTARLAAEVRFQSLDEAQRVVRRNAGAGRHADVQKSRLISVAPRLGGVDR